MNKIIIILTLLLISVNVFAFTITKDGKPFSLVVLGKDATEPEKYACEEFVKYIEKITGAKLSVRETPKAGSNNIIIGQTRLAKSILKNYPWNKLKDDGIIIHTDKKTLVIAGDRPRGTIYAVYEALQKIGVVFLTSKEEYIPNIKTIDFNINKEHTPPFMSRDLYSKEAIGNPIYNTKIRCNGFFFERDTNGVPTLQNPKYGGYVDLLLWVHSFRILLNPEKYKDHPEYFALVRGERQVSMGAQICLSNPNMVNEVTKNVLRELDMRPNTKIISVSQNDNENKCECENCKALYEKYGNSGAVLTLINHVAREVAKKYPETYVETLAYNWTMEASKNIVPEDNVIIRLCTSLNSFARPIKDQKTNGKFYKSLTEWSKISKSLYIWDYCINFYNSYVYFPNIQNLQENFKLYRDNKVKAIFCQCDFINENYCMNHLRDYLLAKLMWDPDINFEEEKMKFMKLWYGPGAEDMNKFIKVCGETALREQEPPIFMSMYSRYNSFFTAEDFIKAFTALTEALKKAENNEIYKDRVLVDLYSFQAGFIYAPSDIQKQIYDLNILEYNSRYDFLNMFISFAKAHGDENYNEGTKLENSDYNINNENEQSHAGKPTEVKEGDTWKDIQENDFLYPVGSKIAKVVDDIWASNGCSAISYPYNKTWGIQKELRGLFVDDRWTKADMYITYRIEEGKNSDIAFFAGVYDKENKRVPFQLSIHANDTPEGKFITKKMGTLDLKGNTECNLYICGADSPECCKAIYVDRVFVIFQK
ncbi:MAG: DUF4838 domain-containing protein [Abditibacteriota bacterium]|nr:DUF4838 domain-containing protein [Abditibacteriota bacterium]